MRVLLLSLIIISFFDASIRGQAVAPKYSNEFLAIGVGARALAMSGSQVAIANDVTAGYWNPAGLLDLPHQYQASFMHAAYFAGLANYDYLAFTAPADSLSRIGVSVIRFGVDNIPDTRFLFDANGAVNYNNIEFFSAADYAFLFSYARKLPIFNGIQVGGNVKIIHRTVGDFANAWGFGFDVGAKKQLGLWMLGVTFRDVTSTFNAWSHNPDLVSDTYNLTGNEIPQNSIEITLPRMVVGAARYFTVNNKFGALASADLEFTFDGKRNTLVKSGLTSIDPRLGFELDYNRTFFLRTGLGQIQQIKDFDSSTYTSMQATFGLGFNLGKVDIDYALTDIGDQSESLYSHVFSIKVSFDEINLEE